MRRIAAVVIVAGLAGMSSPSVEAAKPKRVKLTISNFHYCQAESCSPLDVGYLRTGNGPVMGTDNPQAVIEVKRRSIVSWVYRDESCDMFGCPGHNVVFENGTMQGARKGFVPSGRHGRAINVRINAKVGSTIRYFCSVDGHYQRGMTGILHVVK